MSEMKSLTLNDVRYDGFVDPVARALAGASAVIKPASGESITLPDSSGNKLYGLNIYGKTTQSGTPTPDAPVELVSLGKQGGVTVTIAGDSRSQNIVVETPNGLPGIPVSTGGNYVDAAGQQWVGDVIDLERGVYVRRVNVVGFGSAVGVRETQPQWSGAYRFSFYIESNPTFLPSASQDGMCNALTFNPAPINNNQLDNAVVVYQRGGIFVRSDAHETVGEFVTWAKNIGLKVQYPLATPIETPLTEEEIATYNALRTYREGTTVTNDAGAYMDLEYAMDAKTYIDSVIAGATGTVRLTEVTLPASAWTGADSLYSQVVTINGITQYSKVDLLPSVEQLAIFHNKDVAFVTENEDGVVTVYAIGDKPTNDYVIQASITEVAV